MADENGASSRGVQYVQFHNENTHENTAPDTERSSSQVAPTEGREDHTDGQTGTPKSADRLVWAKKIEFLLTAVSFAVGLGNVWRFPHLCYTNGGGAFLIPYIIMLLALGLPLYFLEVALGQYASLGPITVWRLSPLFKGLGYAMLVVSLEISVYYNVIIAFTLFYFFASFSRKLPWATCESHWNTPSCIERQRLSVDMLLNLTNASHDGGVSMASPAEEYWKLNVNGLFSSINLGSLGHVQWRLALCLILSWVIVYLCIMKGIRTSSKVVYFTAIFPYVILTVLLIRGVTLPGAGTGIRYYLTPDFKKMGKARVWRDAAVQIMYSLGVGSGGVLTIGSYNKFNNNCHKDAILISLINSGTSVYAGFVIFSVLGFMAFQSGISVDKVVQEGTGLAFIAYPEALALLPGDNWIPNFFSVLFFFMLLTLGIGSQFPTIECCTTAITDEFPRLRAYKAWLRLGLCGMLFLLGLPCVTQGGLYLIELIDTFSTSFPLLFITIGETLVISWLYGFEKFTQDIQLMVGFRPCLYWRLCWAFGTPILIVFVLIFTCVDYNGIQFNGYTYPPWAEFIGWLLSLSSLIFIPLMALIQFIKKINSCHNFLWLFTSPRAVGMMHLMDLLRPTKEWGPARPEHREQVVVYHTHLDIVDILDLQNTQENPHIDDPESANQNTNITGHNWSSNHQLDYITSANQMLPNMSASGNSSQPPTDRFFEVDLNAEVPEGNEKTYQNPELCLGANEPLHEHDRSAHESVI